MHGNYCVGQPKMFVNGQEIGIVRALNTRVIYRCMRNNEDFGNNVYKVEVKHSKKRRINKKLNKKYGKLYRFIVKEYIFGKGD